MRYISLFTGIGGLESRTEDPMIICERDIHCKQYLQKKYKSSDFIDDVKILSDDSFSIAKSDIVTGGWPCQDLSVAGERKGFKGVKSVLFYDLLKVALKSKCETIVAENVPNLLNIDNGEVFSTVLKEFANSGYNFIGWRVINTRSFNLPHQRRRLFIVASKSEQIAKNLFNPIKNKISKPKIKEPVNSFYHTAGTHSICFSENYTPTLKVSGGGLAVQYNNTIRRLSSSEVLKLQGFKPNEFKNITDTQIYSMAGNAVSKPVGNFIFDSISTDFNNIEWGPTNSGDLFDDSENIIQSGIKNGFYRDGAIYEVRVEKEKLCSNLADFINFNDNSFLSNTAVLGLLRRSAKAKKSINNSLLLMMIELVSIDSLLKEIQQEDLNLLIRNSISSKDQKYVSNEEESLF
tara:strand:- start:1821 stop:3035 length:1215 start_codon:yes stop_codon:yes gene_type:complete